MDVSYKLFPAFFLRAHCKDHGCSVEVNIQETIMPTCESPIGMEVTPLRCPEGGMGPGAPCISSWTISTSARDLQITA